MLTAVQLVSGELRADSAVNITSALNWLGGRVSGGGVIYNAGNITVGTNTSQSTRQFADVTLISYGASFTSAPINIVCSGNATLIAAAGLPNAFLTSTAMTVTSGSRRFIKCPRPSLRCGHNQSCLLCPWH